MNDNRIFVDTNILVYAYDKDAGGKQKGKSRTDPCLGIAEALSELREMYGALKGR